jgi:hypothetical protein
VYTRYITCLTMYTPHVINLTFYFQGFRAWHQPRPDPNPLDMPKDHRQNQRYRRSRVFLDFLCMNGDEESDATICPAIQCTTSSCWCPKEHLSDQDVVNPCRDTADIRERVAEERKKLLHRHGRPSDRCREKVLTLDISVISITK